ncbi:hypothetical protein [Methanoregula sp.]|uniref:hypothetical protein n=1 Tax=Methanoregula sp. TaxID=2052170 RepID=UPI000CAE179B|nr:hypothetical protein [Methanoregula sp.]PKG32408.1 MAG: hypothetical protein CW742_08320 [Methanoregula sp.]
MVAYATSPVKEDLTVAPLRAKVHVAGVTADSDGFYYKARQLVEITGDEEVGIATNANKAIGVLEDSITTKTNPNGLDTRTRISVIPFGYRRVLRMTAEGQLTAGQRVTQGTTSKQAVKAAAALAGLAASGSATASAVDATRPTVAISGGVPAEEIIGVVWKGAANGAEALILAH